MNITVRLKQAVPSAWRRHARMLSRLRWLTKARVMAFNGLSLRAHPATWLAYVLFDPEVDSFTYAIDNEPELVTFLSESLGLERSRVASLTAETRTDPELNEGLRRRVRWRPDYKRQAHLGGYRTAAWVVARALRPALIVETGILDGLGSLVLLRALERNGEEGHPGRLLSFDTTEGSGWLVPTRLRALWEPVYARSEEALVLAIGLRRVGMLVQDSDPSYANQRAEFSAAVDHRDERIALLAFNNWETALSDVCSERLLSYGEFREQPRHWYKGAPLGLGLTPRPS